MLEAPAINKVSPMPVPEYVDSSRGLRTSELKGPSDLSLDAYRDHSENKKPSTAVHAKEKGIELRREVRINTLFKEDADDGVETKVNSEHKVNVGMDGATSTNDCRMNKVDDSDDYESIESARPNVIMKMSSVDDRKVMPRKKTHDKD